MATWQYELDAYPRDAFLGKFPDSPQVVDRDLIDELNLWAGRKPLAASELSSILPVGKAWDSEMRLWGDSESNQISFFVLEDGRIDASMRIRIDLRGPCKLLLKQVVDLCARHDLVLLNMQGKVIEPRIEGLVEDPRGFLDRLKDKPIGGTAASDETS